MSMMMFGLYEIFIQHVIDYLNLFLLRLKFTKIFEI